MVCEKTQTFSVEYNTLREHKCPAREHKLSQGEINSFARQHTCFASDYKLIGQT